MGDRVKTDGRDDQVLAEIFAIRLVTEGRIPAQDEEEIQDLSRLRSATAKDLGHVRQHVDAILVRHGIRYPRMPGGRREHYRWLQRQHVDQPLLQFT